MADWLEQLKRTLGLKKPLVPPPEPAPVSPAVTSPALVNYYKAWQILQGINWWNLGGAITFTGIIVFFALSGLLAWITLGLRFLWRAVRSIATLGQ